MAGLMRCVATYRKQMLVHFVSCRFFVAVQQRQEEKRQKEELYKEKDRERKRVQSSKKVICICNMMLCDDLLIFLTSGFSV